MKAAICSIRCLIALLGALNGNAGESAVKYLRYFTANEPFDLWKDLKNFDLAVNEQSRLEVLRRILEIKEGNTEGQLTAQMQCNVMNYLMQRRITAWKDIPELQSLVLQRMFHGDPSVRSAVLDVLTTAYSTAECRLIILACLGDSSDMVRGQAIDKMSKFADAEELLQAYIRQHEMDEEYKRSLSYSKEKLRKIKSKANEK
jgi:hypothetical protein